MSYKDIQDIIEKRKAIKEAQKRKMRTPALHGAGIVSLDKDGNVIGEAPVASATAPAETPVAPPAETPAASPVETPSEEKPVEAEAAEEKPAEPEAPKKVKKYQKKKKASAPEENAD